MLKISYAPLRVLWLKSYLSPCSAAGQSSRVKPSCLHSCFKMNEATNSALFASSLNRETDREVMSKGPYNSKKIYFMLILHISNSNCHTLYFTNETKRSLFTSLWVFSFFSEQSFETLFALKILIEKLSVMSGFLFYSEDVILLCELVSHLEWANKHPGGCQLDELLYPK